MQFCTWYRRSRGSFVSIPQAVSTIAIIKNGKKVVIKERVVSIPHAVGTIAIEVQGGGYCSNIAEKFQYRKR